VTIDARSLPAGSKIYGDVCIVGAGAAGIAIAHELCNQGLKVILLESGSTKLEASIQNLYKGEILDPNHGILDEQRQRQLGGTTNVWGGRCAPFDAIDFVPRDYVTHSGWPITKADLDPYYARAHTYCELGSYQYQVAVALPFSQAEMIPELISPEVSQEQLWLFSPPTNFRRRFIDAILRAHNIELYLYANCLQIVTDAEGKGVDHLVISSLGNNMSYVYAKQFVLAAGCLEVTRLLLLSNQVHAQGLGNENDLVGRFYMGHITGDVGEVHFTSQKRNVIWDYEKTIEGVFCRRSLSIPAAVQKNHQLMNFRAILTHPPIADPSHSNGVLSAIYLAKVALLSRSSSRIYYSKRISTEGIIQTLPQHLKNVLMDWDDVLQFVERWLRQRVLSERKLPSAVLQSKSDTYFFHFDAEQSPNPNSRVMLGDEKDAFGLNRLRVDWRYTDADIDSVVRTYELLAQALEKTGTGKLDFTPEAMPDLIRKDMGVGSHHIGTTRMADNPSQGVVDANCKLHSLHNLYIASSSVFPTSSFANPTLTIVAIAIRLADHLKELSRA
jgi:GMC oxidoreductase/FAD binding domain